MGTGREARIDGESSSADPAAAPYRPERGAGQSLMDVYVIPVARDRYELYCEHDGGDIDPIAEEAPKGDSRSCTPTSAKRSRASNRSASAGRRVRTTRPRTWTERMKDRGLCWIAEKIAEQRLLWRLRNESELMLHYPDDIAAEAAVANARAELQREADRHMKWIVIDGILFVASGVVVFRARPEPDRVLLRVPARRPLPVAQGRETRAHRGAVAVVSEPAVVAAAPGPDARAQRARARGARDRVRAPAAASGEVLRANLGQDRVIFSVRGERPATGLRD